MPVTTFEGRLELVTPKAIRFQSHYWEAPLWFPLSQVFIEPDSEDDESVVILKVKDWLANKRGLLEFTAYNKAELEAMDAQ